MSKRRKSDSELCSENSALTEQVETLHAQLEYLLHKQAALTRAGSMMARELRHRHEEDLPVSLSLRHWDRLQDPAFDALAQTAHDRLRRCGQVLRNAVRAMTAASPGGQYHAEAVAAANDWDYVVSFGTADVARQACVDRGHVDGAGVSQVVGVPPRCTHCGTVVEQGGAGGGL